MRHEMVTRTKLEWGRLYRQSRVLVTAAVAWFLILATTPYGTGDEPLPCIICATYGRLYQCLIFVYYVTWLSQIRSAASSLLLHVQSVRARSGVQLGRVYIEQKSGSAMIMNARYTPPSWRLPEATINVAPLLLTIVVVQSGHFDIPSGFVRSTRKCTSALHPVSGRCVACGSSSGR